MSHFYQDRWFGKSRFLTSLSIPVVYLTSVPEIIYINFPATISGTCFPTNSTITIIINGEMFGNPITAINGIWSITAEATEAMIGNNVIITASITGSIDYDTITVANIETLANLTLDLNPSRGAYLDTGRIEHLRNWAASQLIDPNVDNWLEQNTTAGGPNPYTITETISASVQHAAYKDAGAGTGIGVFESLNAKRGVGTRNIRLRAGALALVDFDLGAGTKGTETNASGTIGTADAEGFYPLTIAAVPSNTFMYLNLLSGTTLTYVGDGTSSLLVRDIRREYTAWQGTDGNQPSTDNTIMTLTTDDYLTTQVAPIAATGTLWGWVKRSNVGINLRTIIGTEVGAAFCTLGLDANHYPVASIGAQDTTIIKGEDGNDVPIDWAFLAVTWDSSNVHLYHGDGQSFTECYTGAQSGSVPITRPVFIGAINDDGAADTFWEGSIARHGMGITALNTEELEALAYVTRPTLLTPTLALPSPITLVAGDVFTIRDENITLNGVISATATCPYTHAAGILSLSPIIPGNYEMTITATNAGGSETTTITLNVVSAATPTINLLIVGDSITAAGYYVDTLANDASATNITLLGLTTTTAGTHPVEGHGGWDFAEYRDGATSPMAPAGVIDIPTYITALGATPNVIIWALGTNDVFGMGPGASLEAAIDAAFEDFDQLKTAWDAVDATIIHILALPAPGNSRQSAFDTNYTGTNQDRWKFRQGVHRWNERVLTTYDNTDVVVLPLGLNINQTDGYPFNNALHPDASGGEEMAQTLISYLQSI